MNIYIAFAYKATRRQTLVLRSLLPKWASAESFDIEAKAPMPNPTKDQMRLMMQSLLSDRFKFAMHWESKNAPVYAFELERPGSPGPNLRPHSSGPACGSPQAPDGGLPVRCGVVTPLPASATGRKRFGVRNVNTKQIVGDLQVLGALDREVLDKTGLSATYDFSIEWAPEFNGPSQPNESNRPPSNLQTDSSGPAFVEALKEQLGLKLQSTTGPVDTLVLDHVERPSPN